MLPVDAGRRCGAHRDAGDATMTMTGTCTATSFTIDDKVVIKNDGGPITNAAHITA